jgi:hypothetical protein
VREVDGRGARAAGHFALDHGFAVLGTDPQVRNAVDRIPCNPEDLVAALSVRWRGERVAEQDCGDAAVVADDVRSLRLGR